MAADSTERSTQQRVAALFEIRRQQQAQLQSQRQASMNEPLKSPLFSAKSISSGSMFPMGPVSGGRKDALPSAAAPTTDARKEREARRQRLVERQKERAELAKQKREEKRKHQDVPISTSMASPMSERSHFPDGAETDEYDDTTIRLPNRRKPSDGSVTSATSSHADAAAQKTLQTLQHNRDVAQQRRPSLDVIAEKTEIEHLQKVFFP